MSPSDRPPVVLIHGFATSTQTTWRDPGWFDLLNDAGRRAIGIDLLGHGDAPKPTDPADYADLAGPVLAQMPESPVDIIGYSLGARTAIEIALAHPERIRKMVLAGVGRNVVATAGSNATDPFATATNPGESDESANAGPDTSMAPHIMQRFEALIATAGADGPALRACMSAPRPLFTTDQLAGINIPCLLVMGDDDFAGPPEPLADALPDSRVKLLRNVDHFGLPKQFGFIDAALEFIDAVPDWN